MFILVEKFPDHKCFVTFEMENHDNYIRQAFYEGKVFADALFENGGSFITLMEADTDYEINKFIRNHPDVQEKRLQAKIKLCKPVFWKMY